MVDISPRTETYLAEDRSWLGSAHGTTATASITLDLNLFTKDTHYPKGFIPSGFVVGKVEATGMYGPYDDAATDGRQTAAGHLFSSETVRDPKAHVAAALLQHGVVIASKLPAGAGLDDNAKTDLSGSVIYR